MLKDKKKLSFLLVIIFLILLPLMTESTYFINLLAFTLIFALLAMSLDLLVGYMGLASLGHAGFFGAAAYCAGIMNTRYDMGFVSSFFIALFFSFCLAVVFGFFTTRISGVTFLMVNLALGQVVWGLAYRWCSMTGGDNGLIGIKRPEILGIPFKTPDSFYYLLLFVFCIAGFLLYRLVNSPFGLTMRGIKHSSKRMKALGYNVFNHRYITYVISGTFAGIAGIMFAFFNQFISPMDTHIITSAKAFLMVLVGGAGTLFGPILGAALVVALENFISAYTARWVLILGILYIVTVMYSPGGMIEVAQKIKSTFRKQTYKTDQTVHNGKGGVL